jgi:RNA polymerase sigma-70 factor (ECF subfamily)
MTGEVERTGAVASASEDVTELLLAWRGGDQLALEKLTPIVYQDLRRLARRRLLDERAGHTLQPTAVVNEAYMRLVDYRHVQWQDRAHFFAVSAQLIRRVLVDHARRRNQKRGGGARHFSLELAPEIGSHSSKNLVALDDALNELARMDARKAKVVELRYFAGLSVQESAEALGISAPTVMRDWSSAKAWLHRELTVGGSAREP